MKFLAVSFLLAASAAAMPLAARDASDADIARLAPELGFVKGQNPTGSGDCTSGNVNAAGEAIRIPCSCPPDRADFIAALQANVHAGAAVNNPSVKVDFPTDDSKESKLARITASSITIQNLEGPGVGCPIAATTLKKQAQEIEAGSSTSTGAASTDASTTEAPATSTPDAGASGETESSTLDVTESTTFDEPTATATESESSTTSDVPETTSNPAETNDEPIAPTTESESQSSTTTSAPVPSSSDTSDEPTSTQSASPTVTDAPQSTGSADGEASDNEIAALVPEFGVEQGANPTGTGDCDGVVGPAGSAIRIPCQCPPKRADFIQTLISNVRAGQVLNNPSIKVTFPLDDSKAGKQARLNAAAVTLQNLSGEGKGCPIAATTWKKLGAAIDAGTDVGGTAVGAAGASTTSSSPSSTSSPAASSSSSGSSSSTEQTPATSAPAPSSTDAPTNDTPSDADVARLAPSLGFEAGQNPTGTGDCDGAVKNAKGQVVKVPCACPPTQDVFIAALQENVRAGQAVNNPSVKLTFPTGDSTEEKLTRINAAAITIQNLNGAGKGCPVASTTLGAQAQELRTGKTPSSPAPASSSSSSTAPASTEAPSGSPSSTSEAPPSTGSPEPASDDVVARLAPSLGHESGLNPTGTGNCDGAVTGADGKTVEVPCTCPPPQDVYIAALQRNVREGKAVNNPSVGITFPTGDSKEDQSARITAALITLQNLDGVGKGCPAASTTLLKQQKALFA